MNVRKVAHINRGQWILLLPCLILLPPRCPAEIVADWNEAVIAAIKVETPPPALAARNLAIIHLAILKAVAASEVIDHDFAAGAAAHEAASALYPTQRGKFDALASRTSASGGAAIPDKVVQSSRAIARALLESRSGDGATTTVHYVPGDATGQWRRTLNQRPPETPHWGAVRPFLLTAGSQFRPPAPDMKSEAYAVSWNDVRRLGSIDSSERTTEQTMLAKFWSDFSYTSTPPGHWNSVARELARSHKLDTAAASRLFAVLNVAMSDASVAMFDTKYSCNFWRPETAIHRANEDGNDRTSSNPDWKPLLPCPPHPEYVSGHSAFSGAAAVVLSEFFPAKGLVFHAHSDTVKDVTRTYTSFDACAREVGQSRVWAGIHFPMSCERGLELGQNVGRWVLRHFDAIR